MNTRRTFRAWLRTRPSGVRTAARTIKPWNTYRLRSTGQVGQVVSYWSNGTVTMEFVDRIFGAFHTKVFGIKPSDLERIGQTKGGSDER